MINTGRAYATQSITAVSVCLTDPCRLTGNLRVSNYTRAANFFVWKKFRGKHLRELGHLRMLAAEYVCHDNRLRAPI